MTISIDLQDRFHSLVLGTATLYCKNAIIQARQVIEPERVKTILSNGLLETAREVPVGHWVITNPGGEQYAVSDEKFQNRYEPVGDGHYRAKGIIRAYQNPTGESVEIMAPWGEKQVGDTACWFAAATDKDLNATTDRCLIGGEEFRETYIRL